MARRGLADESARIDKNRRRGELWLVIASLVVSLVNGDGNSRGNPFHKYSRSLKRPRLRPPQSPTRWLRSGGGSVSLQKVAVECLFARL